MNPDPATIAYLVNQYPASSQTFIRREIAAIEALSGRPVPRYAIRGWPGPLLDPDDQAEVAKTRRVLDVGAVGLALATLRAALLRPARFLSALWVASELAAASGRNRLKHGIYLAEACVLLRWVLADQVGHLHVHFGTNSVAVALLCRTLGGPSYSFTVHGPEEFDHPNELGLAQKIRHATFVATIGSFGRSQLWRWLPYADWPKVQVVPCGVDPSFLEVPASMPPDRQRLVNIGRLEEQKGQMILVEAARILRDRGRTDFEVVVVGGGSLRDALAARIAELGLEANVRLAGWMSGAQIRQELLGARGFVIPSFAEGLPVVIMEALALRRPVIATYIASVPELVRPGESGWLVPAGDVEALADAMAKLLDTPVAELAEMGDAGHAAVAERHDVRRSARLLLDFIRGSA